MRLWVEKVYHLKLRRISTLKQPVVSQFARRPAEVDGVEIYKYQKGWIEDESAIMMLMRFIILITNSSNKYLSAVSIFSTSNELALIRDNATVATHCVDIQYIILT